MSSPTPVGAAVSPWTARDRVVLVVLLALGVVGLIAGYTGTSGTLRVSRQVVWINVSGVALLVSGVGVILFLTAARREIGCRRLGLFGNVAPDAGPVAVVAGAAAGDLVAAATMTKYHRADCSFVDGKTVAPAAAATHQQAGRRPCGVCLPGGES